MIFLIALLTIIIVGAYLLNLHLSRYKLSFVNSIARTELPIVTLISNGKPFNFLVDTGSNLSHLKIGIADEMDSTLVESNNESVIMTGNGNVEQHGYYDVNFVLGGKINITQRFEVMDLEETFSNWGMPVCGILGVDFLSSFGYKVDFNTFTMYV